MGKLKNFDVNAEVTNKLTFKPIPEQGNFCFGKLVSVDVTTNLAPTTKEDGSESNWEYAGMEIPSLNFNFENHKFTAEEPDRFFTHKEGIIGLHTSLGERMKEQDIESLFTNMWKRVKHLYDSYSRSESFKPISDKTVKAIQKVFELADEDSKDSTTSVLMLKAITNFYKLLADDFNRVDKPIYKSNSGKSHIMRMKLVPEYKQGKWYTFPSFVGKGFIEMYRKDVPATLEFAPSESVVLSSGGTSKKANASSGYTAKLDQDLADELGL